MLILIAILLALAGGLAAPAGLTGIRRVRSHAQRLTVRTPQRMFALMASVAKGKPAMAGR